MSLLGRLDSRWSNIQLRYLRTDRWIVIGRITICIGKLPMFSGNPWGIWVSKMATTGPALGRFVPKLLEWEWHKIVWQQKLSPRNYPPYDS